MWRTKFKLLLGISFLPLTVNASFIETTMGTATVNDATAAYFNPAALILLKNSQIIPLFTVARFKTRFSGQTTSVRTLVTQSGADTSTSNYFSPSFYFGIPVNQIVTLGFAAVTNYANRDPEQNAVLRYIQASNSIEDYDFVPSIGVKINDKLSLGGGINFSYTNFNTHPIIGFPGSNIADSQSTNQSRGSGIGANVGFLIRPRQGTLIGFNYRTITTYDEKGKSTFSNATQHLVSNNYNFEMRTPARSILSISQKLFSSYGLIATVQRIHWSVIRNVNINNIATSSGVTPIIVSASVPYYLHNTWVLTLGGSYNYSPQWVFRVAGTFNQAPSSGDYQISTGDSFILGGSVGYTLNKIITVDGGYAHAFIQNQKINTRGNRFLINGTNLASRDSLSLKLTFNI